jgi:hypothetical protein
MQSIKQLPLIITATSGAAIAMIVVMAISTGYGGVINIRWGLDGGQIFIDGSQHGRSVDLKMN